ncbi:hypothetical protein [Thalassoglobus sp.]|uniref:hypothetical protein n=1 Tax=Thalassoglobus sp. TaxID=2795869 RepID=UPI003AA7BFDD
MKLDYSQLIFIALLTWGQNGRAEEQSTVHNFNEFEVVSSWSLDFDEAYEDASLKLRESVRQFAGLDNQNFVIQQHLWSELEGELFEDFQQITEIKRRAYGDLHRVVLRGTISSDSIRTFHTLSEKSVRTRWWKWTLSLVIALVGIFVGLHLTIRLDQASGGDRRTIMCVISTACVVLAVRMVLCGIW